MADLRLADAEGFPEYIKYPDPENHGAIYFLNPETLVYDGVSLADWLRLAERMHLPRL